MGPKPIYFSSPAPRGVAVLLMLRIYFFFRLHSGLGWTCYRLGRVANDPRRTWTDSPSSTDVEIILKTSERWSLGNVAFTATESSRGAGQSPSRPERRNARPVAIESTSSSRDNHMNRHKPTYFRNSLDLRDKVQVKVLRKRLKLSHEQFTSVVRKSGSSILAITKEASAFK
ncbi:DUF3606 domain-containing protein [Bradyrhizobium japonicum]|uniref:DUF3606 domain-containing protein n=2 Tax=Bradyrhizobium japonicum TaxID=375 RepID=UPI00281526A8|nr:DUF3606 domain-containing protein [Bradyrhizobium japonicum]